MHKRLIGLIAVAVVMLAGLVSTQAEAAPMVPTANQVKPQSLVEDAAWFRRSVRRPYVGRAYVRRPVVRGPVVRRPVRRTLRRATRPWRW